MFSTYRTDDDPLETLEDLDHTLLELIAAGYLRFGRRRETPVSEQSFLAHGAAQGDWLSVTEDEVRI